MLLAEALALTEGQDDPQVKCARALALENRTSLHPGSEAALADQRAAIALREAAQGPRHLDVARALIALGITASALGLLDEATSALERADALYRQAPGQWVHDIFVGHPQEEQMQEKRLRLFLEAQD